MDVNSLPKSVTRQRRDCDVNPGPSVPESSTLTTRLPSRSRMLGMHYYAGFTLSWLQKNSTTFPGLSMTPEAFFRILS